MTITNVRDTQVGVNPQERAYLKHGLSQPGGKLPLFDAQGQEISAHVIRNCLDKGLCEPWFANPLKPDWLVCRLTPKGRKTIKSA